MKKILLLSLALMTFTATSFAQDTKAKKANTNITAEEKAELKKDKEAFKATLTADQKAKLKAIKKAKKDANIKSLPKKEQKAAKKKFKDQKMAVYTPEQRKMLKAYKEKKKRFKKD